MSWDLFPMNELAMNEDRTVKNPKQSQSVVQRHSTSCNLLVPAPTIHT